MARPVSSCPQCGAKIEFRWSGAVQTTCDFCQSILIRSDMDWTKVGTMSDLPQDASPIQLNTEGVWKNKAFTVAGRIVYDHALGSWNEWHLLFQDGTSGWLSDAQLEWAISFHYAKAEKIPKEQQLFVHSVYTVDNVDYIVSARTRAVYRGVEGDLPFAYWDKKSAITFVDFRTPDNRFATLDYSENPPLLFLGQFVDFDELQLKNLRQFEGWF
jgi:hypothetical protein